MAAFRHGLVLCPEAPKPLSQRCCVYSALTAGLLKPSGAALANSAGVRVGDPDGYVSVRPAHRDEDQTLKVKIVKLPLGTAAASVD